MSSLDTIAIPLANGERPATWGLNLNAFPQGQADLGKPFHDWKAKVMQILNGTGAYIYESAYLHVTASSPAPFTYAPLAEWKNEEKELYQEAWHAALKETCVVGAHPSWPSEPFPLTFKTLELHASCAIFMVDDPQQGLRRIREAVAAAAEVVGRGAAGPLLARSGWKSPKIVHSTIMRLVAPCSEGINVAESWGRAAALWPAEGVTIMAHQMTFLKEVVPYQHLDPDPNSNEYVIHAFPYGPGSKPYDDVRRECFQPPNPNPNPHLV